MCKEVVDFLRDHHLPAVTVESNGIGCFLPGLLRSHLNAAGLAAAVREQTTHRAKVARILAAFDAPLAAGRLLVHSSVLKTPFAAEMTSWAADGKSPDDGLDAVAGCLLAEPVRLNRGTRPTPRPDWRPGATPVEANTDFVP